MNFEEMCMYQVKEGKIVKEQFFYDQLWFEELIHKFGRVELIVCLNLTVCAKNISFMITFHSKNTHYATA